MRQKNKGLLYMVGLICVYVICFFAFIKLFGNDIFSLAFGEMKVNWIVSTPEFIYESDAAIENDSPYDGEQYGELICEAIDLRVPVYYGDSEKLLEIGVGIWTEGDVPGRSGTVLIGGHDTTFFQPLEHIKEGNEIILKTRNDSYQYRVTKTEIKKASEFTLEKTDLFDDIISRQQIILYTCYPFGKTDGYREERYLVYAEKK